MSVGAFASFDWLFVSSLEVAQSHVMTHAPVDLCGPSTSLISSDFTANHANTTAHIDRNSISSSRTAPLVETQSRILIPKTTPPLPLPYHVVAASILPAMATSSVFSYADLVAHQAVPCASPPPSLLTSQSSLTTKIRGGRSLPLASTKFIPYWSALWISHLSSVRHTAVCAFTTDVN